MALHRAVAVRGVFGLAVVALLGAIPVAALAAATERVDGRNLTIEPKGSFDAAEVRVTGPGDFRMSSRFDAGMPIKVDLGAAAEAAEEIRVASLPDGQYQYEVTLRKADRDRALRGLFYVENGKTVSREEKRIQLAQVRGDLAGKLGERRQQQGSEPSSQAIVYDYLSIVDYPYSDGVTGLYLGGFYGYYGGISQIYGNTVLFAPFSYTYLALNYAGNAALDTFPPIAKLHVGSATGGEAKILVEEKGSPVKSRILFELKNNGGPFFIFRNNATNTSYSFAESAGTFIISHQQTQGIQFRLRQNGNLEIAGTLSQASSRDVKEAFAEMSGTEVLERVKKLPLSTWKYKSDPGSVRHAGPVAEDFRAAFGLGRDAKSISPGDVGGVALAAIQGLDEKNERRIAQLEQENTELRERLDSLERVVRQLAAVR